MKVFEFRYLIHHPDRVFTGQWFRMETHDPKRAIEAIASSAQSDMTFEIREVRS